MYTLPYPLGLLKTSEICFLCFHEAGHCVFLLGLLGGLEGRKLYSSLYFSLLL